jgi:hypothetical protein
MSPPSLSQGNGLSSQCRSTLGILAGSSLIGQSKDDRGKGGAFLSFLTLRLKVTKKSTKYHLIIIHAAKHSVRIAF